MCRLANYAPQVHGAGVLGVERVGDIVLTHLPSAPARDVEELVVEREVDVGDQGCHRPEVLEQRRQLLCICGLCRDVDHLLYSPSAVLAVPEPDRGRKVLKAYDDT